MRAGGCAIVFRCGDRMGPFDVNTRESRADDRDGSAASEGVAAIVARRKAAPFKTLGEVGAMGVPAGRLRVGGNLIWTLRASARLKRPDGMPSETWCGRRRRR